MQFSAFLLLTLLTLTLVLMLYRRGKLDYVVSRSRWFMAGGMALLAIQFLLQYILHLREMGVTQAVMLNLLIFVPSSWLFSIAVLYLQRQGRLKWHEWMVGGLISVVVASLLAYTALGDGQPLFSDTPAMVRTEWICAVLYAAMQFHYTFAQYTELRKMGRSLEDYYDRDMASKLRWMKVSIWLLTAIAVFVPAAIFISGLPLFIFSLVFLGGLYYFVHSFKYYVITKRALMVMAAQQNAEEAGMTEDNDESAASYISDEDRQRVDGLVAKWMATGKYLHSGITMPAVAAELHVTQPLLRAWYHSVGYDSFPEWMQHDRIEYAKKMLVEHPEWTLDSIAEQCGFSSRNYFHKVFLKTVGVTPAQYLRSTANGAVD